MMNSPQGHTGQGQKIGANLENMAGMRKIIHLDELTAICGHFYMDNGYNCSHPDCNDQILFSKNGNEVDLEQLIRNYYYNLHIKKKESRRKKQKNGKEKETILIFG